MERHAMALSVVVDGRRYDGFFAIQSRMMTVWSPALGSRTTWIEPQATTTQQIAEALLVEIVGECDARLRVWASRIDVCGIAGTP